MTRTFKPILLLFLASTFIALGQAQGPAASQRQTFWFKGNTHTHTKNSDGDASPETVATWYADHGYDFLVLTDHEFINDVTELNSKLGRGGKFLLISGQEITDRFDKKPYHVNGLGLTRVIQPGRGTGAVANIQKNVDAVRDAGGIAQINHPNFGWAMGAAEIAQIKGTTLLEIFSGHPLVNMQGGGGVPSVESMWDSVLSAGHVIYAVAVDDAHHYSRADDRTAATPGHGWVVVRAPQLTSDSILSALAAGDFYASTGVELDEYTVGNLEIRIKIREKRWSKYTTQFIGAGGKVLLETFANPAVYRFRGNEKYVRAKILESNGTTAWTQPVFPRSPKRIR